jgi:hypothetical protein
MLPYTKIMLVHIVVAIFVEIVASDNCIPVIGFGVISDPMNFCQRLVSSIDFCVTNLVVVHPSDYILHLNGEKVPFHEAVLSWQNKSLIKKVTLLPLPYSLIGVAEGWNKIIRSDASAPWYMITAYDVEFLPGQLSEFSRRYWSESLFNVTNFAHTKWLNLPGGKGFNLFAFSRSVIENCGYFDENIFPAFWEDRDYQYRMSLWPGSRIRTFRTIKPWHGEHDSTYGNTLLNFQAKDDNGHKKKLFNYTSGTVYLGLGWKRAMAMSSEWNIRYVVQKWGCLYGESKARHALMNCSFSLPFNMSNNKIGYWEKDINRIQRIRKEFSRSPLL